MTHSPPPEPPSRDDSLGFDDFVGVFVAIAGIGALLFWVLGSKMQQFSLSPVPSQSAPMILAPTTPASPDLDRDAATPPSLAPASPEASIQPSPRPTTQPRTPTIAPVPVPIGAAPTTTASAEPVDTGFLDVSPTFWAAPFIVALSQQGILAGFEDGTFRPNAVITRAEVAVMLQEAFDQPENLQPLPFSDVPTDYWASSEIASSVQSGFMRGYPGGLFQPEQQIPKAQMLIALASGLNLPSASNPDQVVSYYQDSEQIPQYAIDKVAAATTGGLVVNYPVPDTLRPEQTITRADAAALIYQALVKTGKVDRIDSEYIVQP
jgi:S-layer homology domain